jgi:hypothetical protein
LSFSHSKGSTAALSIVRLTLALVLAAIEIGCTASDSRRGRTTSSVIAGEAALQRVRIVQPTPPDYPGVSLSLPYDFTRAPLQPSDDNHTFSFLSADARLTIEYLGVGNISCQSISCISSKLVVDKRPAQLVFWNGSFKDGAPWLWRLDVFVPVEPESVRGVWAIPRGVKAVAMCKTAIVCERARQIILSLEFEQASK